MLQGNGVDAISSYLKNTLVPRIVEIRSANIYDREETDLQGFPAATITLKRMDSAYLDNTRNKRIFEMSLKIFIDRNSQNFGVSKAEQILRTMANDLVAVIDADYSLGGNCIFCEPFVGEPAYIDRENNNIRFIEVTLRCVDANSWR